MAVTYGPIKFSPHPSEGCVEVERFFVVSVSEWHPPVRWTNEKAPYRWLGPGTYTSSIDHIRPGGQHLHNVPTTTYCHRQPYTRLSVSNIRPPPPPPPRIFKTPYCKKHLSPPRLHLASAMCSCIHKYNTVHNKTQVCCLSSNNMNIHEINLLASRRYKFTTEHWIVQYNLNKCPYMTGVPSSQVRFNVNVHFGSQKMQFRHPRQVSPRHRFNCIEIQLWPNRTTWWPTCTHGTEQHQQI